MQPEQIIAEFLKPPPVGAYTDEKLAALLAHAEDGKLVYQSCCCLIGVATADHALRGEMVGMDYVPHYAEACEHPMAAAVESAFCELFDVPGPTDESRDAQRRAKLIPLIKAEFERRARVRGEVEVSELVTV